MINVFIAANYIQAPVLIRNNGADRATIEEGYALLDGA